MLDPVHTPALGIFDDSDIACMEPRIRKDPSDRRCLYCHTNSFTPLVGANSQNGLFIRRNELGPDPGAGAYCDEEGDQGKSEG